MLLSRDGFPVEPVSVDGILVYPGERYDFTIDTRNVGVYKITADMRRKANLYSMNISGLALLNVTSDKVNASAPMTKSKLRYLNCPFEAFPNEPDVECIPLTTLNGSYSDIIPYIQSEQSKLKQTFFLNFGRKPVKYTINAVQFKFPSVAAISQPEEVDLCPSKHTRTILYPFTKSPQKR